MSNMTKRRQKTRFGKKNTTKKEVDSRINIKKTHLDKKKDVKNLCLV